MVFHALGPGGVGLVDVHALDWTTEAHGCCCWVGIVSGSLSAFVLAGGVATDGVVEDEDSRSAGSGKLLALRRLFKV